MENISKSRIDKVGKILTKSEYYSNEEINLAEQKLNQYRMNHLRPLTKLCLKIREWLENFSQDYYIAQRLKRIPRIIEKLKRLNHMRLSQLQDIGGCRIIVENAKIQDDLFVHIMQKLTKSKTYKIYGKKEKNPVDYREKGRDDSGYRAIHIIVETDGVKIEVQIRSNMQHYWAESIERTSIIYGQNLKSLQGNLVVIQYFKTLSDIFYEIECNREPAISQRNKLDKLMNESEDIIRNAESYRVLHSSIKESFIKAMESATKKQYRKIYNWLLIFNWKTGEFVNWIKIDQSDSVKIAEQYASNEKRYNECEGFEVVLIGASSVETIRHTHSHYFGLQSYDKVLDGFDDTLLSFKKRKIINPTGRRILNKLINNKKWGYKVVTFDTIKNHYCKDFPNITESIEELIRKDFIIQHNNLYSLNSSKKDEIFSLI